jgi:hypothetical protein
LTRKTGPNPNPAIIAPAIADPRIRDPVKVAVFRLMAFVRESGPTISR